MKYRNLLLGFILVSTNTWAECIVQGRINQRDLFEVVAVESIQPYWKSYGESTSSPTISDDIVGLKIETHCVVNFRSEKNNWFGFRNKHKVVMRDNCDIVKKGTTYNIYVVPICSEFGKDFYSYLDLNLGIIKSEKET